MKYIFTAILLTGLTFGQNLQLHYELAEDREYFVSTLEMFKPDNYGSTFWFVDMEYNSDGIDGVNLAYWEIARAFTLPVKNISATVQYNDGVAFFGPLGQVWLLGVNYYLDLGFAAFPLDILYRKAVGSDRHDLQLTTTWFFPLLDGNIEFSGFLDVWTQDDTAGDMQLVILSEPQLWYNANDKFSIGGEVEISHNFVSTEGLEAKPTLGLRWNF